MAIGPRRRGTGPPARWRRAASLQASRCQVAGTVARQRAEPDRPDHDPAPHRRPQRPRRAPATRAPFHGNAPRTAASPALPAATATDRSITHSPGPPASLS